MNRFNIKNSNDALLYLTDCHLATVSDLALKKSKSKSDFTRHIQIAQLSVNWVKEFNLKIENGSRLFNVITFSNSDVKKWSDQYNYH